MKHRLKALFLMMEENGENEKLYANAHTNENVSKETQTKPTEEINILGNIDTTPKT